MKGLTDVNDAIAIALLGESVINSGRYIVHFFAVARADDTLVVVLEHVLCVYEVVAHRSRDCTHLLRIAIILVQEDGRVVQPVGATRGAIDSRCIGTVQHVEHRRDVLKSQDVEGVPPFFGVHRVTIQLLPVWRNGVSSPISAQVGSYFDAGPYLEWVFQ